MDHVILAGLMFVALMICVSSIDDLVIDALVIFRRVRSQPAGPKPDAQLAIQSPRSAGKACRIGIFVANWHEADILENMVEGNLASIGYRPITFFLGVYPNDHDTKNAALRIEAKYPELVKVIVNPKDGPTSKGQMLNVMFSRVFGDTFSAPDLAVIHDSEDVIDPLSFECYAEQSRQYDFIQIPVFSLDSRRRSWVGAHYMEEFAERHSREMPLRSNIGVMIPSAGVGTCMTKRLITHFLDKRGSLMVSDCVTEDYMLGVEVHREGFRSTFVDVARSRDREMIATREYFPRDFRAAVKQKSRWTYGIAFEGTRKLGWEGSLRDRFFFYRDRKGAITNLLPMISLILLGCCLLSDIHVADLPASVYLLFVAICLLNTAAIAIRYCVKISAMGEVYGFADPLGVLVRWPVAICVNFLAVLRAWKSFITSGFAARAIGWDKTQHEVPVCFVTAAGSAAALTAQPVLLPMRITALAASGDKVFGIMNSGLVKHAPATRRARMNGRASSRSARAGRGKNAA